MKKLNVSIEIRGEETSVGQIVGDSIYDASFCYDSGYINRQESIPVSISLPFQKEPFSAEKTRNFFEGLLPEGFSRKSAAKWMHADEHDYLSILYGLGRECIGAIRITDEQPLSDAAAYKKLSMHQLQELACEGIEKSAQLVTEAHLSLTGASGKAGVYYDETHHNWYLPTGTAPSTHILKQSHVRLESIITNEQLSLLTASKLGLKVPESFIVRVDESDKDDVLFATRRYDRVYDDCINRRISNHRVPLRLHQEDFASALGIAAADKYENHKNGYLKIMSALLRDYSADPVNDQLMLWDTLVYDFLLGNTDNHLKNFSLLYGVNMRNIRLAPAYDIISTVIYPGSTRNMAVYLGNENSLDRIGRSSFLNAASEIGIGSKIAMKHFDDICSHFSKALSEAASEICDQGYIKAEELQKKILYSGGIHTISAS